jgi:RHS repeat-associated protein
VETGGLRRGKPRACGDALERGQLAAPQLTPSRGEVAVAKIVRQFGRALWVIVPLALVVLLVVIPKARAVGGTYSNPRWTNTASVIECICDSSCCEKPPIFSPEGVSYLDGHLQQEFEIGTAPGRAGGFSFSLLYSSRISGTTQLGVSILPSWEHTLETNGDETPVTWRLPTGQVATFTLSGGTYSSSDCGVHWTLTKNGSGRFVLTSKHGRKLTFDANLMLDKDEDANGVGLDLTYNHDLQLTGITDDCGRSYVVHSDANKFMDYMEMPGGARVMFARDSNDRLTTITTPSTPDQQNGSTLTLGYDSYHRLVTVQDRRGNTTREYFFAGSTAAIDYLELNNVQVDFSYASGRIDRTDRNGNIHRWHSTGANITKHDMWIGSPGSAQFATNWTYSGSDLVTVVYPRNNRVDFTVDGNGNVTQRRRKTNNTSSMNSSDIVEYWSYTNNRVTSYTDPLGNQTLYTRDSAGNITQIDHPDVTYPVGQTDVITQYTVNSYGQVTQQTDEEGKVTTYDYFTSGTKLGLLKDVHVDPSGLNLTTSYDYDSNFNVSTVTNPLSKVTTTTWDSLRRRTQVTDPMGVDTKYYYDANNNLVKMEVENLDKDGSAVSGNGWWVTEYTYTVLDQLATIVEEYDVGVYRTTSIDYDSNGNRIRVTKPEGNKDKWTYNARDLVASKIRGETSGVESTEEFAYDVNGNLTESEDARNNDTTYTYDLFDRRTKTTNALGHYEETDYDKGSNVTEIRRKDSSNNLLQRETHYFDERNRHWKTSALHKDPGSTYSDAVTTYQRFKTGHMRYVTNARSKLTESQYDNAWRLTKTIDAMGNELANTYNAGSLRTSWSILEKDGSTNITHEYGATYDDDGRPITKTETDRTNGSNVLTTAYDYDSRGNLVWVVNALGNPTRYTFDGVGRMTKKEVALSFGSPIETFTTAIVTEWGFDKNNRLTSFKDDAQNTSTWTFDAKDRVATMVFPNTSQDYLYSYDANDNVVETTDPAGNVIADTFDALNRNTARDVTLATGFVDTTAETRAFDALNRVTSNEDDDYKVEYTYGVLGLGSQVYAEAQSFVGGSAYTKTVTRTWNAVGGKATEAYPSGLTLAYSYNDIDAYSSISDGTNTIASWTYVGTRPKVVTFQNGMTQTNSYSGFRNEIATIHHETGTPSTILRLDYGYNAVHDRTYERYGASGSSGDAFEYDKARRLTVAWMGSSTPSSPSGNAYVKKIEYNMDDDGNRTSVVTTVYQQSPTTVSYTDNNLNQYTAVGSASPSYDANGNQTDNGTHTFKYNYKNLICEVRTTSGNALVANYYYDALGRRIEKVVAGGITERYVYSGLETVCTYDGSNSWKQDFVFGQGIDEVLMLSQADVLDYDSDQNTSEVTRSFYHRNALGSVLDITAMDQAVEVSYRYDPYGVPTITRNSQAQSSDPLQQPWAYTSRLRDEETALYYYRAREYDGQVGRFLARDPELYRVGNSLYEYVASTPTNAIDPEGRIIWFVVAAAALALTSCGDSSNADGDCVCRITCNYVLDNGTVWTDGTTDPHTDNDRDPDRQLQKLEACKELGGAEMCQKKCKARAEEAQENGNNARDEGDPSKTSGVPEDSYFDTRGTASRRITIRMVNVHNTAKDNYTDHKGFPTNGKWQCQGKGTCE